MKKKQTIPAMIVVILLFIIGPVCAEGATWITLAAIAVSGVLIRCYDLGDYHGEK